MASKLTLKLKNAEITFKVVKRANQKRIIVKPDFFGYQVSAPSTATLKAIKQMILVNQNAILNMPTRLDFKSLLKKPSNIKLFGKDYPIVYRKENGGVVFNDDLIVVKSKSLNENNIERLLYQFLKTHLIQSALTIHHQTKQTHPHFPLDGVDFDARYAHTKFGTCYPSTKLIRFNLVLVHYPIEYLKFIYYHEISHLKHANHSKAFYETFTAFEPHHKSLKKSLERYHEDYMRDTKNHI